MRQRGGSKGGRGAYIGAGTEPWRAGQEGRSGAGRAAAGLLESASLTRGRRQPRQAGPAYRRQREERERASGWASRERKVGQQRSFGPREKGKKRREEDGLGQKDIGKRERLLFFQQKIQIIQFKFKFKRI